MIKKTAPLENFNHEFSESDEPDGALAAGADVILIDRLERFSRYMGYLK